MTGLFGSLNTATSGMNAQQNALQTTSHNLSNINTPGYSRQRVTMKTAFPQSKAGVGQMGMGVQISGITRVTDEYVTRQLENEMSSFVEHGNISEVLGQLEAIFNEPSESGVSSQMSEFFASWGSLGENPELDTNKKMVVSQSETFLDSVNHIAKKMESLAGDTIGQIKKDVLDFNSAAKQLKKVNEQIFNAKTKGETPNDLLDTQDQLIGQLKTIADVNIEKDQYDRASISFGSGADKKVIVSSDELKEISVSKEGKIFYGKAAEDGYADTSNEELEMTRGSIKGFQDAHKTIIEKNEDLNHFIGKFATTVNAIMNREIDGENHDFFTIPNNSENLAKDIKINQGLLDDPSSLLVGEFPEGENNFAAGDGTRAKAISDLQNISLDFSKKASGDSPTLDEELSAFKDHINNQFKTGSLTLESDSNGSPMFDHYNEIITDMGIIKQQADNMMDNQADLVSLLDQRKESISGVDMNEEVVNMIQQQSAFQANARMINTINEMLDTLINRTGV